jgi:hypothetical protein
MSIEIKIDEKENSAIKEHKWKELLYELFYEIKSEILGCKIEIEEEEYQENVRAITIPKLVDYLHDSIQILIKKKIDDTKLEQKKRDKRYYTNNINTPIGLDEKEQYENIIRKLESKERKLSKIIFQNKLQKDVMENKISEYMEMEDEFEEMKTKLKYEEGRFLKNDRKDNEIIIIRGENSNLKQSIKQLEEKINLLEKDKQDKTKIINELQDNMKKFKLKLKDLQKQNEILNAHCINININNVNGNNNNKNGNIYNNNNNINPANLNSPSNKDENINKNKMMYFQKINKKFLNNKIYKAEALNNTRNESLERTRSELFNKYFVNNKVNKNNNNMLLNNSAVKINSFQYGNNNRQLNQGNHNELPVPLFSNRMNHMNNYNVIKKNIISGANSSRSNSTKIKGNPHKIINYKYLL